MWAWASSLKPWVNSSKRSIRSKVTVWELAYPSVVPLSRVIRVGFGRRRMTVWERRFHFPYQKFRRVTPILTCSTSREYRLRRARGGRRRDVAMVEPSLVSVVDDDESVRESLPD